MIELQANVLLPFVAASSLIAALLIEKRHAQIRLSLLPRLTDFYAARDVLFASKSLSPHQIKMMLYVERCLFNRRFVYRLAIAEFVHVMRLNKVATRLGMEIGERQDAEVYALIVGQGEGPVRTLYEKTLASGVMCATYNNFFWGGVFRRLHCFKYLFFSRQYGHPAREKLVHRFICSVSSEFVLRRVYELQR